jgi:hypothetical protein
MMSQVTEYEALREDDRRMHGKRQFTVDGVVS